MVTSAGDLLSWRMTAWSPRQEWGGTAAAIVLYRTANAARLHPADEVDDATRTGEEPARHYACLEVPGSVWKAYMSWHG